MFSCGNCCQERADSLVGAAEAAALTQRQIGLVQRQDVRLGRRDDVRMPTMAVLPARLPAAAAAARSPPSKRAREKRFLPSHFSTLMHMDPSRFGLDYSRVADVHLRGVAW